MKILGIETSCDDTAVSLININRRKVKILFEAVSSQIKFHRRFGGIVPEVAARKHIENLEPMLKSAFKKAAPEQIDRLAVTIGPGLITSLLIGVEASKTLSYAWHKPLVPVNHLEGHILSVAIKNEVRFPAIALIVSGGHTSLFLVREIGNYQLIGQTLDDAAGEAFDKVAKLLKLGYPGGPVIEKLSKLGRAGAFDLPRPMINHDNYDFSFSGLKTAVLYLHRSGRIPRNKINDLCASFQQAVTDVLISKTIKAAIEYRASSVLLTGGVSANKFLRHNLNRAIKRNTEADFFVPHFRHSTDNATMIAVAGYYNKPQSWQLIKADPNKKL